MNEVLFKEICQSDLDNLNNVISKGNYETSDFENAVSRLQTTLAFLIQAMEA